MLFRSQKNKGFKGVYDLASLVFLPLFSLLFASCSYSLVGSKKMPNTLNLGMGINNNTNSKNYLVDRVPEFKSPLKVEITVEKHSPIKNTLFKKRFEVNRLYLDSLDQKFFRVRIQLLEINKVLTSYEKLYGKSAFPNGIIISNTFLVPERGIFQLQNIRSSFMTKNTAGYSAIEMVDHFNNRSEILLENWLKIEEDVRFICLGDRENSDRFSFYLSKRPKKCESKINRKKMINTLIQ